MRIGVCLGLALLVGAVYCRSINYDYASIDDNRYVTNNKAVIGGLSQGGAHWAFTTFHDGNYLPLTWLSLMADSSIYGGFPGGYRLTNLILHAANAILLFCFFDAVAGSRWRSAFVAAMFAVHPLHVESVVWITERKDVLSIFFGLLALNAYASFVRRRQYAWLALCWGLFVCSLLAKQTLVTLPFLLLLLDYWPFERLAGKWGTVLLEKLPFLLMTIVFSCVAYTAQAGSGATVLLGHASLSDRLANAVAAYGYYLLNLVWPMRLAFFYPYPGYTWGSAPVLISAAVLLPITAISLVCIRVRPQLFVGWCWFLGTLVPLIGLVQIGRQGMADRYVYFAMIGMYVFLAWSAPPRIGVVVAPVLVACSAAVAFVQVGYWKDSDTLFGRTIAVAQDNDVVRGLYGSCLVEEGRFKEGIEQLRKATELAPDSDFAHEHLGSGLAAAGQNAEAIQEFKIAISLRDDQPSYYSRLAAALAREGKHQEAAKYFARAVQLMPELEALARTRQDQQAIDPAIARPQRREP
jgi:tetratricopeptide (TPR) repeat protein